MKWAGRRGAGIHTGSQRSNDKRKHNGVRTLRKLKIFFVTLICLLTSNIAYTLGVGDIKVNSALNQPLDAEIKLFAVRPGEAENIRVTLGSLKDFANAGIDRPLIVSFLKFNVVDNKDGSATINVTSTKPIKEPFLDFLVEVDWSGGRLLREYTMLLDPPVFAQRKAAPVLAPIVSASAPAAITATTSQMAAPAEAASAPVADNGNELFPRIDLNAADSSGPIARATVVTTADNYKVKRNDTLWTIASSLRADSSVSIEQMMMALLRNNPQAFTNNNINGLKSGFILRVPERSMIDAMTAAEAVRQTREQNELWRNARETIGRGETPTGTQGEINSTSQSKAAVSADPGVKLVTPKKADASHSAQGAGTEGESAEQLALANEQLTSKELENADLKGRLGALQDQIASMERLLNLKEDSLAELQEKLGEKAATASEPEPAIAKSEPEPAPVTSMAEPMSETKSTGDKSANRFALDDIVKAEIPEAKTVTKPKIKTAVPAQQPAMDDGILGFVKDLLNNVAIVGVLVVVVLVLIALIWLVQRRRMAAVQFPESILTGKPATTTADSAIAEETSLLSDFAPSAMSGVIESEAGEVDPLSEADVYLAYNKHQQAEELLRSAIDHEPDRLDLKLKLMEVYYSAKNADAFLALASEVNAAKGDRNAALWDKAVEMGRDLIPNNELFRDSSSMEAEDDFSDLQGLADLDELEAGFDEAATEKSPTLDIHEIDESDELELDMSGFGEASTEVKSDNELDISDMSLDLDMLEDEPDSEISTDLGELDLSAFEDTGAGKPATEPAAEFDLGELDMELDSAMSDELSDSVVAEEDEMLGLDEVATKLDLAKAYIDMGDPDGARAILDEVLNEGSDVQKSEAQGLINEL